MFILPILKLALFCKKRPICRGVSTSVEGRQAGQDGRVGQKMGDGRQETEGRRGNPDLVGMGVLAVASFSISRILYLLDVYYISKTVGCQVNSSLTADYADCADCDRFKPRRRQGTRDER